MTASHSADTQPGFVSKLEATRLLRISSRTLNDCIRAKYLEAARVNGRLLVSVQINRMLEPHPMSKAFLGDLKASPRKNS
jgi:hypothetical protein